MELISSLQNRIKNLSEIIVTSYTKIWPGFYFDVIQDRIMRMRTKQVNSLYISSVGFLQNMFFLAKVFFYFCKKEICLSVFLRIKARSLRLEVVTNLNTQTSCWQGNQKVTVESEYMEYSTNGRYLELTTSGLIFSKHFLVH